MTANRRLLSVNWVLLCDGRHRRLFWSVFQNLLESTEPLQRFMARSKMSVNEVKGALVTSIPCTFHFFAGGYFRWPWKMMTTKRPQKDVFAKHAGCKGLFNDCIPLSLNHCFIHPAIQDLDWSVLQQHSQKFAVQPITTMKSAENSWNMLTNEYFVVWFIETLLSSSYFHVLYSHKVRVSANRSLLCFYPQRSSFLKTNLNVYVKVPFYFHDRIQWY